MNKIVLLGALLILGGCASVPLESQEKSTQIKAFSVPPTDKAGLYIYRKGTFGGALKKDVWVDNVCIGETAPNTFFYTLVEPGKDYKLSTESEFSPNAIYLRPEAGKNHYVRQYIKMGVFVGGAGLENVDETTAQRDISKLKLATPGTCSQ